MAQQVIVLRRDGHVVAYHSDLSGGLEQAFQTALAAQRRAEAREPDAKFALSIEPVSAVKTVQYRHGGRWHNIEGHGCADEAEMQQYVDLLSLYGPGLRVADVTTNGEKAE